MRKTGLLALVMLTTAASLGCQSVGRPRLFAPAGTAQSQQMAAQVFDPYPEDEIGPPVVGGRPQGYTNPPTEAARARWVKRTFPWLVRQR